VDLAGSERADATGAKGERLKVCTVIVVSLVLAKSTDLNI